MNPQRPKAGAIRAASPHIAALQAANPPPHHNPARWAGLRNSGPLGLNLTRMPWGMRRRDKWQVVVETVELLPNGSDWFCTGSLSGGGDYMRLAVVMPISIKSGFQNLRDGVHLQIKPGGSDLIF